MHQALDPLDIENIHSQYEFQTALLHSLDLLESLSGLLGITGIDGQFHPLPPLDMIQSGLQDPALRRKVEQGFDRLLLVLFALPLHRFLEAWRRGLRRNAALLKLAGFGWKQPLWVGESYNREDLVYFPKRFEERHGGRTKANLLATDPSVGWQVLLIEGRLGELPCAGQGQTIAGRPQIEAGLPPWQYLGTVPNGEIGWTPETYIAAFLTALEGVWRPLDGETFSFLTGSYLPTSGRVPRAYWHPLGHQAYLGRYHPDFVSPLTGARAAVKVL